MRQARLEDLRVEAPPQMTYVIIGYIGIVLSGVLAVAIGHYLNSAKRTLPNGERVALFRPKDREHGHRIFVLGLCSMIIWLGIRLWRLFDA